MKVVTKFLDNFGALLLAIIWVAPLLFAFWAATHSTSDAVNLNLFSPWTLENFRVAWAGAPWRVGPPSGWGRWPSTAWGSPTRPARSTRPLRGRRWECETMYMVDL